MLKIKKSGFLRAIPLLITILALSFPAYAKYSGGTGEPNDPYQIATAEDLILLGESPEDYNKQFILTADIDLHPHQPSGVFDKAVIAPDVSDAQYDFQGTPFTGIFDGNGHIISHLTIEGKSYLASFGQCYLGLFGQLGPGAAVTNLGLDAVYVYGTGFNVGTLVGNNWGNVLNCYSAGECSGAEAVGGLVGDNSGAMISCYSIGTVSGTWQVGGLVGCNRGGIVTNCYSTGSVSSAEVLADWLDEIVFGGLVGCNLGEIANCYATGSVSGKCSVGGFVGKNFHSITNCYSTGTVSGDWDVGGFVGSGGDETNCFWDMDTSDYNSSDGGHGLSTEAMWNIQTYLDVGWDFVGEIQNGLHEFWQIPEGGGYPVLSTLNGYTMPELSGHGTPDDPYLISTATELFTIYRNPTSCYKLVTSIDFSDSTWAAAPIPIFAGTFNGNGFAIRNLTISGKGNVGLFGWLQKGTKVKSLGVVDAKIYGTGEENGILVGYNNGSVTDCYSTGYINGRGSVGGLIGKNEEGSVNDCYSAGSVNGSGFVGGLIGRNEVGSVSHCYSTGTVSGVSSDDDSGNWESIVGGLVGFNRNGHLSNCHSTATVSGGGDVGGLVGANGDIWPGFSGTIANCYSTGIVLGTSRVGGLLGRGNPDFVTCCFWDRETSDLTTSAGGTAKTTTEMQTASTFLEEGWDFVNETDNGTEDIWWIDEGKDYPRLWWERPTDDLFFLVVDDFESYNDINEGEPGSNRIYKTWLDGYDDPNNGSIVGYLVWSWVYWRVHSGEQSMPFSYDNSGPANYSEATANIDNLAIDQDWTIESARVLSLWFYGDPANAPEMMYVALANANGSTAVVYHDNPDAAQLNAWTEWRINLQEFVNQGVSLTDVDSITIGFGNRNNPVAGGSGQMHFDDIRLYRPDSQE